MFYITIYNTMTETIDELRDRLIAESKITGVYDWEQMLDRMAHEYTPKISEDDPEIQAIIEKSKRTPGPHLINTRNIISMGPGGKTLLIPKGYHFQCYFPNDN